MKSSFLLVISLAAGVKKVLGAACTPAQLQGTFGSFRLTGGGGTYAAGTNQIVSYDDPAGTSLQSLTDIVIVGGGNTYSPTVLSGLPVDLSDTTTDTAGSISVLLPNNLPAGSFVFRVTAVTTTGTCTVDSIPFTSTDGSTNPCVSGQQACVTSTGFLTCNANNQWGPLQQCGAGLSCTQTGSTIICTAGAPGPVCSLGNFRCDGTGFQQCFQGSNGPEWTATQPCSAGTHCESFQGNSIICAADNSGGIPPDECSPGETICSGTSAFESCIQGPQGNLVFGAPTPCNPGTSCSNGLCTSGIPGSCEPGFMQCTSATTFQECTFDPNTGTNAYNVDFQCSPGTTCGSYQGNYILCS